LDVTISSSGNVTIEGGQVTSQTVKISSSGNYNAPNFARKIIVAVTNAANQDIVSSQG